MEYARQQGNVANLIILSSYTAIIFSVPDHAVAQSDPPSFMEQIALRQQEGI